MNGVRGFSRASRCRPPWWPANEPWQPRYELHDVPGRRGRMFRRRVAIAALVVLTLVVSTLAATGWLAFRAAAAASPGGVMTVVRAVGMIGAAGLAVVLVMVMRRVGFSFGAVIEGAERVAAGDYTTRVAEYGPPSIRTLSRAFNTMTERLQSHDRLRRDLMADVAHELRTPLTVIQGKLEGLLDGVYPRDDAQLSVLVEETHVLARLIEDLRTVALSESGALKLEKEPTDVSALARDIVDAFGGEADERAVTVHVETSERLPPLSVDPVRIREVLSNLLANALRHTPSGGTIDVRVYAVQSTGGAARRDAVGVDVRDTGTGMTPDEVARAFDRFHKGPGSRGSGLGLTIARGLVAAHGGEIRASSEPGAGTTMTVTLPRDDHQ